MKSFSLAPPRSGIAVHDVDITRRTIDIDTWQELSAGRWLVCRENALILGPAGVGKSYIAAALATRASNEGYTVVAVSGAQLAQGFATLDARLLTCLKEAQCLVVDDVFGYWRSEDASFKLLSSLLAQRHCKASTLLTTGLPVTQWASVCSPAFRRFLRSAICLPLYTRIRC